MTRGSAHSHPGDGAAAVSAAERRFSATAETGPAIIIVDVSMHVRMASAQAAAVLGTAPPFGAPLIEAIDLGNDAARLAEAVRRAAAGTAADLELEIAGVPRAVRCVPLSGERALVLIAISESRPAGAELAALRARANDLEALTAAARRLARSNYPDEVRASICAAAADVAAADLAALIELTPDRHSLVVTAASQGEMEGWTITQERAPSASLAFSAGRPTSSDGAGSMPGWPLGQAGAPVGLWQPIRRADGVEAVVAIGWRHHVPVPPERVMGSLELLADEAAVALERAAALEHVTGMARTDPLTELSNSRAWGDELGRELARAERSGQRLAVGVIDLDDLKRYNDRWGHAAGDRVLLTAAARWRRRLRLTDLLARIGGDEFAVAMPGCGLAEAVELGDQLRVALPDGVTCSVGVAEWNGSESAADLLARADQALYAAKNSGRDATFALPTPAGPRAGSPLPSR